jgi:hypothetical protein
VPPEWAILASDDRKEWIAESRDADYTSEISFRYSHKPNRAKASRHACACEVSTSPSDGAQLGLTERCTQDANMAFASQQRQGISGCRRSVFLSQGFLVKRNVGYPILSVRRASVLMCCVTLTFVCGIRRWSAQAQSDSNTAPASQTQSRIIEQLVEMNSRRGRALLSYEGTRRYRLTYQGFWGARRAEMVVRLRYRAPGTKEFTIVSQDGSRWIIDKIFKGLLQSEREGAMPDNASRMALDPANYEFTLVGQDSRPSGQVYVFSIKPRSPYRYLSRGQIWVDASEFAVVEMRGQPARTPSFWMKNTAMEIIYSKVGDFWLPSRNHSVSQVRLGGDADLTIEYSDYKITEATPVGATTGFGVSSISCTGLFFFRASACQQSDVFRAKLAGAISWERPPRSAT